MLIHIEVQDATKAEDRENFPERILKGKDLDKKLLGGKLFIFRKLFANDILGKRKLQIEKITGKEKRHRKGPATRSGEIRAGILPNTEFSIDKIASLLEVPVSLVEKISQELRAKIAGRIE